MNREALRERARTRKILNSTMRQINNIMKDCESDKNTSLDSKRKSFIELISKNINQGVIQ